MLQPFNESLHKQYNLWKYYKFLFTSTETSQDYFLFSPHRLIKFYNAIERGFIPPDSIFKLNFILKEMLTLQIDRWVYDFPKMFMGQPVPHWY